MQTKRKEAKKFNSFFFLSTRKRIRKLNRSHMASFCFEAKNLFMGNLLSSSYPNVIKSFVQYFAKGEGKVLQFESCCCCMLAVVISQDWWRSLSKYHRYTTAIFFDLYSTFLQGKTKRIISNSPCFDSDPNYQSNCLTFESNLGNKNESEGTR